MATVLLGSELGSGLGHAEKLLVVARALAARGHRPLFAMREPAVVHPLIRGQFPLLQAPYLRVQRRPLGEVPASMAGVFAAFGLDQPSEVAVVLNSWRALLQQVQPALVVADYSPLLCLAAQPQVPAVVIGSGFCVPPPQLPRFVPLAPHPDALATEDRVLAAVRSAQAEAGAPPPDSLPALFAGAAHFVLCLAELDPYRDCRCEPVAGPLHVPAQEPVWDGSLDLFAYLSAEEPLTEGVLAGLARAGLRTAAFLRDRPAGKPLPGAKGGLVHLETPWPFEQAIQHARVVVHHGGLGTAQKTLLSGRPQVVVPRHREQKLLADALVELGAGLCIGRRATPDTIAELLRGLLGAPDQEFQRVQGVGAALRARAQQGSLAAVIDACERVMGPTRAACSGSALAEHPPQGSAVEAQVLGR